MNMIEGHDAATAGRRVFATADGIALPLARPIAARRRASRWSMACGRSMSGSIPTACRSTRRRRRADRRRDAGDRARSAAAKSSLVFRERIDAMPGDDLRIAIDTAAVQLFDEETGQRL